MNSSVNKIRLAITVIGSAIGVVAAGVQARKAVQKGDKLSLVNAIASVLVAVTGGALAIRGARKDGEA
jgi:cell division protein FtsL